MRRAAANDLDFERVETSAVKARARRRGREAGAVMFIVAMTLAVIAAMGMYALNVAATEVKTSGYVREETQIHYLSEYGVLGTSQELSRPAMPGMYYSVMRNTPDTNCMSLFGIPSGSGALVNACHVMGANEVANSWNPPVAPLVQPWVSNATEITRGSEGINTKPDFYVELTDPAEAPLPAGYQAGGSLCAVEFTVTSIGLSQGALLLAPQSYMSEGLESSRARINGLTMPCQ